MNITLLEAGEYYQTLVKSIPKAKKRIVIATMILLAGERTTPIFALLHDAIQRGVVVTILFDNYSRLPILYDALRRRNRKALVAETWRALEALSQAGATIYCFGKIGFPPYKGRCHVKATVIDNHSYSFGGVNLFDRGFELVDYMLANDDAATADCLVELVHRIGASSPPLNDGEVQIAKQHSIIFDGGRPSHSLIYERACELTARAKRVHYVSMMPPSGQLAHLLNETTSAIYVNRAEQMLPIDSLAQAYDLQKYRISNKYTGAAFIHAKFMLFELANGRKALLSGSHNFSYRGVVFGTQEIALYSTSPALWEILHKYLEKNVRAARVK